MNNPNNLINKIENNVILQLIHKHYLSNYFKKFKYERYIDITYILFGIMIILCSILAYRMHIDNEYSKCIIDVADDYCISIGYNGETYVNDKSFECGNNTKTRDEKTFYFTDSDINKS